MSITTIINHVLKVQAWVRIKVLMVRVGDTVKTASYAD